LITVALSAAWLKMEPVAGEFVIMPLLVSEITRDNVPAINTT